VNVNFYQFDPASPAEAAPRLAPEYRILSWQPAAQGLPPRGSRLPSNHMWWALTKAAMFARRDFTEIRIERAGRVLHRLIVTPRWYRFPFMAARDLQIGDVWTAPDARRKQLGRAAIAEAHRLFNQDGANFWYVADSDNAASAALAESCGYRLVATGRRTRRLGSKLLGQYVIERYV
jgi:RimJ/RimL family protein N-acetyltransferase